MLNNLRKNFIDAFYSHFMALVLALIFCCNGVAYAKSTLKIVTIGHDASVRNSLYLIAEQFEKLHPDIELQFIIQSDTKLKSGLTQLLKKNNAVDIVIWHSGERLNYYIEQGLVLNITNLWNEEKLDRLFTPINKRIVTFNKQNWAIPISYYPWGFYYNKKLFKRLEITPPQNWQQFIQVLNKVKQQNITPIYIGSKNPWPVGCWFEYLNLRLNGLEYHNAFVKGEISAHDEGIKDVLEHWQQLIHSGYFFEQHQGKDLADGMPLLYREQVSMMLSGHIFKAYMSEEVLDAMGYFTFPNIKKDVANVQVTPVDVMFIAKSSLQQEAAKNFLIYAASKDAQNLMNKMLNQFPVNKYSVMSDSKLLQTVKLTLDQAEARTYFYDREVEKTFGEDNLKIWLNFLNEPDINKTITKMEQARVEYLSRK